MRSLVPDRSQCWTSLPPVSVIWRERIKRANMREGCGFAQMLHRKFSSAQALADAVVAEVGRDIVLGLPLGLGKANHIANALYARGAANPWLKLRIFTALTLEKPRPKTDFERRFLEPISERLFAGYPDLAYAMALRQKRLPPNVQ